MITCLGAFRLGATAHGYIADDGEQVPGPYYCILRVEMPNHDQRVDIADSFYKVTLEVGVGVSQFFAVSHCTCSCAHPAAKAFGAQDLKKIII